MENHEEFDIIVIGSGMGGLSAACCLSNEGFKVLILEKAAIPGGCSSSYKKNNAVFESGATTLIGFDEHQPLRRLEQLTGLRIPKEPLSVSMRIHFDDYYLDRPTNFTDFVNNSIRLFGNEIQQKAFWNKAKLLSDLVWRVSEKNIFFPPKTLNDWLKAAFTNSISDLPNLRYLFKSTADILESFGLNDDKFKDFIDEQLMITAQSKSEHVPFLFAAPALTYPHSQNFYVPGGLWNMAYACTDYIESKGGTVLTKAEVLKIKQLKDGSFFISSRNRKNYKARLVILNTPIWNTPSIFENADIQHVLKKPAKKFENAWGAFTMGIVFKDSLEAEYPLHNQIHFKNNAILGDKGSIFVSLSKANDTARVKEGFRVANVSIHTQVDLWFNDSKSAYDNLKKQWTDSILKILDESSLNINAETIESVHAATPITWEKWVGRSKGRVGGLPQSMKRSVLDWPDLNPTDGVYLVGDTTYPGQGIPGVTLSGINVYYRIKTKFSHLIK